MPWPKGKPRNPPKGGAKDPQANQDDEPKASGAPGTAPPIPIIELHLEGASLYQAERLRARLQGVLDADARRYHKFPNRRPW